MSAVPSDRGALAKGVAAPLRRPSRRLGERVALYGLFGCALVSILVTTGIVIALAEGTVEFFGEVSVWSFLTGTEWTPLFKNGSFGVLPILSNTIEVAVLAGIVGLPLGLAAAIFLSEYASPRLRGVLKPALELLAGIPTVVFGFFALTFITPELKRFLDISTFNALAPAIVIGFMVMPIVASLSEDALRSVPNALREGAYGLGATKVNVAVRVVVPAALSGIAAAFMLGVSRAVGETMVLLIAGGSTSQLAWHPLEAIQTMAAFIAQVSTGDAPTGSIAYKTIFAVGMTLFIITFAMNVVSTRLVARYRQVER